MKVFFLLILTLIATQPSIAKESQKNYDSGLQKVFEVQDQIKEIHPFLETVFPIVIAEEDTFLIFDVDSTGNRYKFIKTAPIEMFVPPKIRAAFPLRFYDNKYGCIVTGDIFDSDNEYITIFHEFIHCQQGNICEQKLKQKLDVAQKAMKKKDYMWELNYSFPYEDKDFTNIYSNFTIALDKNDTTTIFECRKQLKELLDKNAYEYMVWQEWKEGFARYMENQINAKLGYKKNHYGIEKPYHRITFYEGGSKYIRFLVTQESALLMDIERLFYKILDS